MANAARGAKRLVLDIIVLVHSYKGSAPRAADTARYARASKNTGKCEGGGKRPMIWRN